MSSMNRASQDGDRLQPGDWRFDQGLTDVANQRGADLLLQEEPEQIVQRLIEFEGRANTIERFAVAWGVPSSEAEAAIDHLFVDARHAVPEAARTQVSACPCFSQTCPLLLEDDECREWAYGKHAPRIYPGSGEEDLLGIIVHYDHGEGAFNPRGFDGDGWKEEGCMPPKLWNYIEAVATTQGYARGYCLIRLTAV